MIDLTETQKKQTFRVEEIEVRIMVLPWTVRSETGIEGCIAIEALVFRDKGLGVRGQAVCVPIDFPVYDFRFGAKLALKNALAVEYTKTNYIPAYKSYLKIPTKRKIVCHDTRKAIWKEFNKVLPK